MFNSRINGLLLGASMVALLAGCSSSKDPFQGRMVRPTEQCLNNYHSNENPQNAFGDRQAMRYVVKKGDTLWGISKRFLVKPWYWKALWYDNPHIRNPHKIYPGDVLGVISLNGEKRITITEANGRYHGSDTGRVTADGRKIFKYKPGAREYSLNDGPITIVSQTIAPFLLKTEIMTPQQIQGLPIIFGDAGDYLTLTEQSLFYSRHLPENVEQFYIYRPVDPFYDPNGQKDKNGNPLIVGYEMRYIGEVKVAELDIPTGVSKLQPMKIAQTVQEKDLLIPAPANVEEADDYFPRMPGPQCRRGYMLRNTNPHTLMVKEFDTVVTSFGRDNGAQVGDVWKIVRPGPLREIDGQPVQIPAKEVGYLMIIKVYDYYSLGFVLDSTQNIDLTDWLVRP